jgi:hypothetical protein
MSKYTHSQLRTPLTPRNIPSQHKEQKHATSIQPPKTPADRTSTSIAKWTSPDNATTGKDLICSWLCLPHSRFGIEYDLGSTTTTQTPLPTEKLKSGMSILKLAATRLPFEFKMQDLKTVLDSQYSHGAGLVYVREFLEPQDPDFPHSARALNARVVVHAKDLSQEQVGRLRILIMSKRRQSALVSTLKCFASFSNTRQVLDYFQSFKQYYAKTRNHGKKLDALLSLTIALCRFNGWMFRMDLCRSRSKMVEGLATRWKNLLATQTAGELELDVGFSFPAVLHLLQGFKHFVETAPTYGDPKMVFRYHPPALASEYDG